MKIHIFLSIVGLFLSFGSFSQQSSLFLIVTSDELFQGIRNKKGDTIIPVEYYYSGEFSADEEIDCTVIDMTGLPRGIHFQYDSLHAAQTTHTTFNRQGEILYHPLLFDNGPDYVQEGLRRFVNIRTGKVGLVRPDGDIVIPATYDFITPMENGYITAYNGVKRQTEDGGEHWTIVPDAEKDFSKIILNRNGERAYGVKHKKDSYSVLNKSDSLYYPLYYRENEKEEVLMDSLNRNAMVKEFVALDYQSGKLIIFDRPRKNFPYYVMGESNAWKDYLLVDRSGKIYYFDYLHRAIPLTEYLRTSKAPLVD